MAAREDQLNTSYTRQSDTQESPQASRIQDDIDRTRARMDETIDELGDRLSPRTWMEGAMESVSESVQPEQLKQMAKSAGASALEAVRNHPVPALCIGVGVAWLLVEQMRSRRPQGVGQDIEMYGGSYVDARTGEPYTSSYGKEFAGKIDELRDEQQYGQAGEMGEASDIESVTYESSAGSGFVGRARHKLHSARNRASDAAGYVRDQASHVGESIHRGYDTGRQSMSQAVNEYPLAVAGGAFALGLVAGLAIPAASWENRLMGTYSDQFRRRAKDTGREIYTDSKRIVQETAERERLTPQGLKERGKEAIQDMKECGKQAAGDISQAVSGAAREVADRAGDAISGEGGDGRKGRGPGEV